MVERALIKQAETLQYIAGAQKGGIPYQHLREIKRLDFHSKVADVKISCV